MFFGREKHLQVLETRFTSIFPEIVPSSPTHLTPQNDVYIKSNALSSMDSDKGSKWPCNAALVLYAVPI